MSHVRTAGPALALPRRKIVGRHACRLLAGAVMLVAGLCGTAADGRAQQASIQGLVTSAATGGPLEGVVISLEAAGTEPRTTLTDRNGFYQLGSVRPGAYTLRGRHIGHAEHEQGVLLAPGDQMTASFRMEPAAVALEGVVVSGERGATVRELGRQRVTPGDLRLVPVPAGSGDLASYLQTLPGVTTTGDRGGQLFVRGGTPAGNLVLVDGIPIYQPFHILGFFSVFPEDLVSSVDFYAGGFGARYSGRTSSVLDVAMRDGNPNGRKVVASLSPFLAEAVVEGPAGSGVSWIASLRRSLVNETSAIVLGSRQPLTFDSQLFKLTVAPTEDLRCSALALRTSDRGALDAEDRSSHVGWHNLVVGGRCVTQFKHLVRLLEVNFSSSAVDNTAVSRGSSRFRSSLWRMQHDAHATGLLGAVPLYAGYHVYTEVPDYDLTELFGLQKKVDLLVGVGGYAEAALPLGSRMEVRPGLVLTGSPYFGVEPRVRGSWQPFGRSAEELQAAFGLYRQELVGTTDIRDVSSVFTAWMRSPEERPVEALHAMLGWQQALGGGLRWSLDGYYKRIKDIPVPVWRAIALFTTQLSRADGEVYGADTRVEYTAPNFYGFIGYGYGWTRYQAAHDAFGAWFGEPVQRYHPPHDRRHQVNAVTRLEIGGFETAARWQLGTGLPFTRPLGFDEAFDYASDLHDVASRIGTTRLILDRPYTGRLPVTHRLDLSLGRDFDLPAGTLTAQAGAINAYDRRNMFYYDLFTGRRVDQLPFAPYLSVTLRSR